MSQPSVGGYRRPGAASASTLTLGHIEMMTEKHLCLAGWIYEIYGILGCCLIAVGAGCIVASCLSKSLSAMQPDTGEFWAILALLITAGAWYTFNIIFGASLRKAKRWPIGSIGWAVALFGLLMIPAGTAMSIYLIWILRRKINDSPNNRLQTSSPTLAV